MKKALLTVVSRRNIAKSAILMRSAKEHLVDWDRIVYVLDLNESEQSEKETDLYKNASYYSAESLFGEDYKEKAFFFSENELAEYVAVNAAKKLLQEYQSIMISESNSVFYNRPAFFDEILHSGNMAAGMEKLLFPDDIVPVSFLLSQHCNINYELFGISGGEGTTSFINWCEKNFDYIYNNAYTSSWDESITSFKAKERSGFIHGWQTYVEYFKIDYHYAPTDVYQSLPITGQTSDAIENAAFLCFKNIKYSEAKYCNNLLVEKHFNEIETINAMYKIYDIYEFNCFSDGTRIHEFLRPYFIVNSSLRERCDKDPFSKRKLFDRKIFIDYTSCIIKKYRKYIKREMSKYIFIPAKKNIKRAFKRLLPRSLRHYIIINLYRYNGRT
jgi:hypothetical protein